jgi:hypothetical protein
MKFFKLLFVAALSATILIGCERQLVSPVDPTHPSQTTAQFAQKALSDLADTAAEREFVDLANAASGVAETLAIDDGTSVEPLFSKIAKLAGAVTILEQAFVEAGCEIELQKFAEASVDAVKAYTIRDAADMEQALRHLAQEAVTAGMLLRQFPAENAFIPFAFGYGSFIDSPDCWCSALDLDYPDYELGEIVVKYDRTIRPVDETSAAAIEFLTNKGYTEAKMGNWNTDTALLYFGAYIDPLLIMKELSNIPGIAQLTHPIVEPESYPFDDLPPPPNIQIIDRVRTRYNEAWCRGNLDTIDSILIEESGLDFFDYAFVRNLSDIYAEEIPEAAERIRMNLFYLRSIAAEFLKIYFQDSRKPLDEIIELFHQSVRDGNVDIEHDTIGEHYYLTTDYWKQLVTDHLNK